VNFVIPTGLVGHVALTGVVFHRRLNRLDTAGTQQFDPLPEERVRVHLIVHRL
jgi:hypothetical protein